MRTVIQRVSEASCTIDGVVTGRIGPGLCILAGFTDGDTPETAAKMAAKICRLRIFGDEEGKMNRSIEDIHGAVLSISQFTLYASCQKGNRPSFIEAARPQTAIPLYEAFNQALQQHVPVQTGLFGADMKISLVNDGPVTIELEME